MLTIKWRLSNLRYYYNYYTGSLTVLNPSLFKTACRKFQERMNITVDGIYGPVTDKTLVTVVKDLQQKLNRQGAYQLTVDGQIGSRTVAAIKDVQQRNGLVIDGIAGKNTFNILNQDVAISPYMTDSDWNKNPYFKKTEFKCECGECDGYGRGIYKTLVADLTLLRKKYNAPLYISSGYRCPAYNRTLVGSNPDSPHLEGRATDHYFTFTSDQAKRIELLKFEQTLPNYRYNYCNINGTYPNMGSAIHYDVKK